eukprot:288107-Amphidinium_carterae.2
MSCRLQWRTLDGCQHVTTKAINSHRPTQGREGEDCEDASARDSTSKDDNALITSVCSSDMGPES